MLEALFGLLHEVDEVDGVDHIPTVHLVHAVRPGRGDLGRRCLQSLDAPAQAETAWLRRDQWHSL
jgi:hypothetical protein